MLCRPLEVTTTCSNSTGRYHGGLLPGPGSDAERFNGRYKESVSIWFIQKPFHEILVPNQSNVDILNNVRREVSRHFGNKKKAYLRAKIEELETNSKIQNIRDLYRGIKDFKKGYQSRCNIVKDEKGDFVADFHSTVARWRKYFSQLFNVRGVKDDGQAEIHTAEPLVPEPSASELSWLSTG